LPQQHGRFKGAFASALFGGFYSDEQNTLLADSFQYIFLKDLLEIISTYTADHLIIDPDADAIGALSQAKGRSQAHFIIKSMLCDIFFHQIDNLIRTPQVA
jgi:hypothetical protein